MPTEVVLFLYFLLLFALALIVRGAYVRHCQNGPIGKSKDLGRGVPYSPPPERWERAFGAMMRSRAASR